MCMKVCVRVFESARVFLKVRVRVFESARACV